MLDCLVADQYRASTLFFLDILYHNLWWSPRNEGGRVLDGYHIEEEFAKCRIAWLLISIMLLLLFFQTFTASICNGDQGMMAVEWLIGITLQKNSPTVGLLGHWSVSCFYSFFFRQTLTNFVMESKEWWWLSQWRIFWPKPPPGGGINKLFALFKKKTI